MNAPTSSPRKATLVVLVTLFLLGPLSLYQHPCHAQDDAAQANINSSIAADGTGTIIVEARGQIPEPPVFYSARATSTANVSPERVEQTIQLTLKVIQGRAKTLSVGVHGDDQVTEVRGENLRSWAVRREGDARFLDLHVDEGVTDLQVEIKTRSDELQLPATIALTHLTPGDSVGFDCVLTIQYASEILGTVVSVDGFVPLESGDRASRFQTATGGEIKLSLHRDGAAPAAVELVETTLDGQINPDGKSVRFQLRGTAQVTQPDAKLVVLSGNAAVSEIPNDPNYQLQLATPNGRSVYQLTFPQAGSFPVSLEFVATLATPGVNVQHMDFTVAASAVVPLTLRGLDADLEFHRDQESVVPLRSEDAWVGFLPATGRAKLQWKTARQTGEGKLFFTTTGKVEAKVGAGLLRQDHQIQYQVLQGELKSLDIALRGPGEILDVQGDNLIGWKVSGTDDNRRLEATLSQPISGHSQINIRSQTALGAFPVRVEGLRLDPLGAIRHSGFLRLMNTGSVRLEPTALSGLNQLAPDQFPGEAVQARQVFVYRFPSAEHTFTIAADRIQPEVNVSELVLYELAETDRVIRADVELDVREAPIREWDFGIPADYSVVSVTGANVADYITASAVTDGRRNLKVVFGQDVAGRQLVSLHLEKTEAASEGNWDLPRIEYPEANSVRGDIGIIGAAGFRISVDTTDLLAEKPLSYFPKPMPNLQQAFRIRQPGWSATMRVERLDRSVQADMFHLYSLSEETVYGSALINYFVTGAPVSQWRITVPAELGNVMVDGRDVRTYRREDDTLIVSLHQPVMGPYTLLVTFEEKPDTNDGAFRPGQITPLDVQGERGFIQVVSPMQVKIQTESVSDDMLHLDPLELPAELRLLSTAPPLGTWQYTERPFNLTLNVNWFEPGTTVTQVVEFAEAKSRVSQDGELVTDVLYFIKTRGQRALRIELPEDPVRLWAVSVAGQPVTARQSDDATLIPLPGGTDPNVPVEVRLRLGKPTVDQSHPELALPTVFAPVLKTQWDVTGDEQYVLAPSGGTVTPPVPVLRPSGFDWVAKRGLGPLIVIVLLTLLGVWGCRYAGSRRVAGLISLTVAIGVALVTAAVAFSQIGTPEPLQLSVPILAAGETIQLQVSNTPLWRVNVSSSGVTALLCGLVAIGWSFRRTNTQEQQLLRGGGILLLALGVLLQGDGAGWFFGLLALAILVFLFVPPARQWIRHTTNSVRELAEQQKAKRAAKREAKESASGEELGGATPMLVFFALLLASSASSVAAVPEGFNAASSIKQQWQLTHHDARLTADATITLSGKPGDRFLLLKAPAILTQFEGKGLRLTKTEVADEGLSYIVSIPVAERPGEETEATEDTAPESTADYRATFQFQLEAVQPTAGIPVLTGVAAVQEIDLRYDEAGWDVSCPTAVRIDADEVTDATQANVLLMPGPASLFLKPKARDVTTEETKFFVEASNLYLPGPGVVDGRHRLHIRTAQGQVSELNVTVPSGLTVSAVTGPVGSWQFDADSGELKLQIDPAQSQAFDVTIETQRGLDPLPTDVTLSPMKVAQAGGEVGLVAIAFGGEAQPESSVPNQMSVVNLGDFDADLITNKQAVLHRVYRYGADGGEVAVRVAPVAPEVRVVSKQVLSLGDERVVLGVNFAAEISRAGLFQLSFPLPEGLEVESLSGAALHHWAELNEGDQRQIILHLSGKTLGTQTFAMALSGAAPSDVGQWQIPRFRLNEATRQTGDLVVRPTTGIRLRTVSRQNVSETDPRTMGGQAQGALAFRLLQHDWNLVLGIEKLDPWVTGQVLHEVTLREGQTRSAMIANFNIQNASVRALQVVLPITDPDVIKTVRASGDTVSDFIRTAADSNIWEIQFKRRVVGKVDFRIEYERRGERENDSETLRPAGFPQARQLSYYVAVRAGGRLELEHDPLSDGWQRVDWSTLPTQLREAENRNAPVFTFRAVTPDSPLTVRAQRHSIADALKLRVAQGSLTTILSPTGDQLTSVDVTVEVIQRSSLSVGLPQGGELFSIFVNGESVHSIRQGGDTNRWQFYILPGIDDRTATVRFVYSVTGGRLSDLQLTSPELNVPLENIQWNVVAPKGFELIDDDGNLELITQTQHEQYDRGSYLSKVVGKRQAQAQQAAQLLEQANELLQAGQQTKARWALNSVANQYALDAASNEDALVQLENLQTQQAIVGLNTRRQRLYLDNTPSDTAMADDQQLRQAAAENPILQQDQLNFRPQQLSQLLRGNTTEDNAVLQQIAARLVRHQRTTEPAPQAIIISLPDEGSVYTFGRTVQVAENAPLELELEFASLFRISSWQIALVTLLLAGLAATLAVAVSNRPTDTKMN
ncbi:hypothetical protein [Stieleria mannarensis]|uniref:hypothetical protein n=1 Tax=Stieleria mannarensis TaxID=2755585 RepID=UPI001603CF48|nr:hypothetical protein [Rhodopirellula sp. JC639]